MAALPPLSILDLSLIVEGGSAADALRNSLDLAQHAEQLGYQRYWVAEHHNMDGVASSATSVLIGYLAAGTKTIRVGSGGVMLPNHAPLVIAEQFGTLATLYPGRIDLGLGRAPGTDQMTMRALRRTLATQSEDDFIGDVIELAEYFKPPPDQRHPVRAIPGIGCDVPIWLLGSSLYSAQVAAHLGYPFAFASHFAPAMLMQALQIYRARFRPNGQPGALTQPHAMVAVNVVCADTDDEAAYLFTSLQQRFLGMQTGKRGPLPHPIPVAEMNALGSPAERAGMEQMLTVTAVGAPATVRGRLSDIVAQTQADELVITGAVHDHAARKRSYELLAGIG
ncbi:LLM class flavin-dependent oxidoreductase [Casimicrobium huifangae]|jgi:luciferase family oxidoreductase group 1|uniref:LLM class flavin-dependent oxidoreductase n=1 Tax=Casimicrobium huifangae TaxID=2591109 RepID=UPI0037842206